MMKKSDMLLDLFSKILQYIFCVVSFVITMLNGLGLSEGASVNYRAIAIAGIFMGMTAILDSIGSLKSADVAVYGPKYAALQISMIVIGACMLIYNFVLCLCFGTTMHVIAIIASIIMTLTHPLKLMFVLGMCVNEFLKTWKKYNLSGQ